VAVADGVIGVGTQRNVTVSVLLTVLNNEPADGSDNWDSVAEGCMESRSGNFAVPGRTDDAKEALQIAAKPAAAPRTGDDDVVSQQGRGPRAKSDPAADLRADLLEHFHWRGDRGSYVYGADVSGWWAEPTLLARLGPALAELVAGTPTVVLGPQSRGALIGATVALHLGIGLVEVRKNPGPLADSNPWLEATTPPDYRDRNLRLGVRRDLLPSDARVLFVDEWIDTGGQAVAARRIVDKSGARWLGAAVVVDMLHDSRLRRDLGVRCLLDDHAVRSRR
jgi:adenine phosphoribosyltransferase